MMNKMIAKLSVITSVNPRVLTKQIFLDENGKAIKKPSANLVNGQVDVIQVDSMQKFSEILQKLELNQSLVYGVPKGTMSQAKLVTKKLFDSMDEKKEVITRSNDHLKWPTGAGIMMFDYDPDGDALDMEDVLQLLYEVCPAIKDTDHLWWTSSSSNIFNDETGEQVSGITGQRVYLMVEDGSDIPRAAKVIEQKLWLADHGNFKISKSGALLERVEFDMSVYQPSRLDFAAGASTCASLSQKRGNPVLKKGKKYVLNTKELLQDLSKDDLKRLEEKMSGKKIVASNEAARVKQIFVSRLSKDIVAKYQDFDVNDISKEVHEALETNILPPYWILYVLHENKIIEMTVEELMAKKHTFHESLCLDPIDPNYDDGRIVGKLYLLQSQPCIHSFARGERVFTLNDRQYSMMLHANLHNATNETLEILEDRQEVFCYGTSLSIPIQNKLHSLDVIMIKHLLSGLIYYRGKTGFCDPSNDLANCILTIGAKHNINPVTGFVDHPIIDSNLKIFDKQGYDKKMKILGRFDQDDFDFSDSKLSRDDVLFHLERINAPFTGFDIASPDDQSVLMGAVFSGILRQVLPTCPAFGFDAPMQGSGKTLLAEAISIITSGQKAPAVAPGQSDSDEEFRKRLLTILIEGEQVCLLDNIVGEFDSASLAAAITSGVYQDRILRSSRSPKVLVKTLFLITGNNLRFTGDMSRRVLRIRLKPENDQLASRVFDFDPIEKATDMRNEIISSVLSLINHWKHCGQVRQAGTMTSFTEWDTLVRQPLAFIGQTILESNLVDLLDVSTRQQADSGDKESLIALLVALASCFGADCRFKAKDVFEMFKDEKNDFLIDAILAFKSRSGFQSSQHFGNLFREFVNRNVEGVVLRTKKASGSWSYWVEFTDDIHRPKLPVTISKPRTMRVDRTLLHH